MKIERDEDTYSELKEMALNIHLISRNYNNEVIGVEYYANFDALTESELIDLELLWHNKVITCRKEKYASVWMAVQVILFSLFSIYIAWLSHPYAGIAAAVIALISIMKISEEKRIRRATRNLVDAQLVHDKLLHHISQTKK